MEAAQALSVQLERYGPSALAAFMSSGSHPVCPHFMCPEMWFVYYVSGYPLEYVLFLCGVAMCAGIALGLVIFQFRFDVRRRTHRCPEVHDFDPDGNSNVSIGLTLNIEISYRMMRITSVSSQRRH